MQPNRTREFEKLVGEIPRLLGRRFLIRRQFRCTTLRCILCRLTQSLLLLSRLHTPYTCYVGVHPVHRLRMPQTLQPLIVGLDALDRSATRWNKLRLGPFVVLPWNVGKCPPIPWVLSGGILLLASSCCNELGFNHRLERLLKQSVLSFDELIGLGGHAREHPVPAIAERNRNRTIYR